MTNSGECYAILYTKASRAIKKGGDIIPASNIPDSITRALHITAFNAISIVKIILKIFQENLHEICMILCNNSIKKNPWEDKEMTPDNCWVYWECPKEMRDIWPAYTLDSGKDCFNLTNDFCPKLEKDFKHCWEYSWYRQVKSFDEKEEYK